MTDFHDFGLPFFVNNFLGHCHSGSFRVIPDDSGSYRIIQRGYSWSFGVVQGNLELLSVIQVIRVHLRVIRDHLGSLGGYGHSGLFVVIQGHMGSFGAIRDHSGPHWAIWSYLDLVIHSF